MRINLRPITLDDGKLIVQWRNNENVRSHCMSRHPITIESNAKFFNEYVASGKYKQFIVERIEEYFGITSYPIATVYLKDMDYSNKRCELCIFTSNDNEWIFESQSIAIKMLLDKAFNDYGMHKVYTYVFYRYSSEIELMKDAGFTIETILKDEAMFEEGVFEDVVRLSVINKNFN